MPKRHRGFRQAAGIATLSLATQGCASVIHGGDQRVTITSTPPGAAIYFNERCVRVQKGVNVELRRSK